MLRKLLLSHRQHQAAIRMFSSQHAQLHAAAMSATQDWSFEDDIFDGLSPEQCRAIPAGGEQSIAWSIWYIARIEDVTMNVLVAGGDQVYTRQGWMERMQLATPSTGNLMGIVQVAELSQAIEMDALRAYRKAVGRRTRRIVQALSVEDIKAKVDPTRLRQCKPTNSCKPG